MRLLVTYALVAALVGCDLDAGGDSMLAAARAGHLPPDPGAEGKGTIEGIDANNNGVRDDVELYIAGMDSAADPGARSALMVAAAELQKALNYESLGMTSDEVARSLSKGIGCLERIEGMDVQRMVTLLHAAAINTVAREDAYLKYRASRAGAATLVLAHSEEECGRYIAPG